MALCGTVVANLLFYSVILYAGNWPDSLRYQQCLGTNLQYDPPQDRELRPEEMDGMLCC